MNKKTKPRTASNKISQPGVTKSTNFNNQNESDNQRDQLQDEHVEKDKRELNDKSKAVVVLRLTQRAVMQQIT